MSSYAENERTWVRTVVLPNRLGITYELVSWEVMGRWLCWLLWSMLMWIVVDMVMVYVKGVCYLWEVTGVTNMGSDHSYGK